MQCRIACFEGMRSRMAAWVPVELACGYSLVLFWDLDLWLPQVGFCLQHTSFLVSPVSFDRTNRKRFSRTEICFNLLRYFLLSLSRLYRHYWSEAKTIVFFNMQTRRASGQEQRCSCTIFSYLPALSSTNSEDPRTCGAKFKFLHRPHSANASQISVLSVFKSCIKKPVEK